MKHALVQFVSGKKKKYLALSEDIKGFHPKSAEDFTNEDYLVKWQESFHDDDSGMHDDGCWPAKILILGGECT